MAANASEKTLKAQKEVFDDFLDMKKARERKYRFIGDRTPQKYWDECEKRFVSFAPPKDISEEDWQANVVMGITRNAVIRQIASVGSVVPRIRFQSFSKEGYFNDVRSKVNQHLYNWSLRREAADKKQQYISLGSFVRGNVCVFEGWEDSERDVEIVTDVDFETNEIKTKKEKIRAWGPKRQVVPLDEIFYKNFFVNDIQDQDRVIWRKIMTEDDAKLEFGKMRGYENVKAGPYSVGAVGEPFFRSFAKLNERQIEVIRWYCLSQDRYRLIVGGVLLSDMPLPFNHKKHPFVWGHNEPFSDSFMLSMSIPFKVMNDQDTADAIWNMSLDKNMLSMQKPIMTDDPDPSVRTFLSPGDILQYTKGSTYTPMQLEGVSQSEFNLLQESLRQAREDAGTTGGGSSATSRGGSVTARQAIMQEEEARRVLGISMTNLEGVEREIAVQRIQNIYQFAPGSDETIDVENEEASGGGRGRFVAILAKNDKDAEKKREELDSIEEIGEMLGQPTEAVAIKPSWFDAGNRIQAEVISESSFLKMRSIEQAVEMENVQTFAKIPMFAQQLDWSEMLRETLRVLGKDEKKLIKQEGPAPPQGVAPPGIEGQAPPEQQGGGQLTQQLSGSSQAKSINALTGL